MTAPITGISSMATRQVLAELAEAYRQRSGVEVRVTSVGGVDAARRVQAGEAFDIVVLARDAIDALVVAGRVEAATTTDLVHSGVSIAVRAGAHRPGVDSVPALRQAVLEARTIGYSTGPSGIALLKLFERWGIAQALQGRLVQAPPGVPVGALVGRGEVELGFQQLSELLSLPGIDIIGSMPVGAEIVTTFSAGRCTVSKQPAATDALLRFLASSDAAEAKRRHGMDPA